MKTRRTLSNRIVKKLFWLSRQKIKSIKLDRQLHGALSLDIHPCTAWLPTRILPFQLQSQPGNTQKGHVVEQVCDVSLELAHGRYGWLDEGLRFVARAQRKWFMVSGWCPAWCGGRETTNSNDVLLGLSKLLSERMGLGPSFTSSLEQWGNVGVWLAGDFHQLYLFKKYSAKIWNLPRSRNLEILNFGLGREKKSVANDGPGTQINSEAEK